MLVTGNVFQAWTYLFLGCNSNNNREKTVAADKEEKSPGHAAVIKKFKKI